MGGIVGRLFREFAVTLSTAILVSMVISLTTTPMMCAYLLKHEKHEKTRPLLQATGAILRLGACRALSAQPALGARQPRAHADVLFSPSHSTSSRHQDPQGLLSAAGHRHPCRRHAGPAGLLLPGDERCPQADRQIIKADPAVQNVIAFTGGGGATNTGNVFIIAQAAQCAQDRRPEIINRLRPKLNRFPSPRVSCRPRRTCASAAAPATRSINTPFRRTTSRSRRHGGRKLLAEMKKLPGLQDVNSDQQNGGLDELSPSIAPPRPGSARPPVARLGLYSAFGQSEVSVIYTQLNQYYVVLEVAPQYWQSPEGLKNIYFHSAQQQHHRQRQYAALQPGHQS
jgi:multidrug efflux pump